MRRPRKFAICILGNLVLMAGCGMLWGRGAEDPPADDTPGGVSSANGATIITGTALQDGPGTLLPAIAGKVPNMRIIRQRAGECPEIILRSNVTFKGVVNPHVYVDGTRASDTCILDALRSSDVARVEVYPLGFTTRPGYTMHSHGLILVFMRSG